MASRPPPPSGRRDFRPASERPGLAPLRAPSGTPAGGGEQVMIRGEGQGVVNRTRHVGLQQLSSFAEAGRTFLGPVKSPKFITDGEGQESMLVTSAARLLEGLDLSGAAGQLLREAILAHRDIYGTGVSTLLFLVGAWSAAAEECLNLGVPTPVIATVMEEGLSICMNAAISLQAPLHQVSTRLDSTWTLSALETCGVSLCPCSPMAPSPSKLQGEPAVGHLAALSLALPHLPRTHAQSPTLHRSQTEAKRSASGTLRDSLPVGARSREPALIHSRHFWGTGGGEWASQPQSAGGCSAAMELGLSHGDPSSMQLAGAAARLQGQSAPASLDGTPACAFDLTQVVTCCLPGLPEAASCVCPGYVAVVPVASAAVAQELQAQTLRVVLLEGDLTESYRHSGFNPSANIRTVLGGARGAQDSTEEPWVDCILRVLAQFHVDLVLARGQVPEPLVERCARSRRLAVGAVGGRVLQAFAEASGATQVAYLTQVDRGCVGSGVHVAPWCSSAVGAAAGAVVTLHAEGMRLVTAVLTSPVAAQMQSRADRFWACACRLYHALQEQKVFLGGGALELWCLHRLQTLVEQAGEGRPACCGGLPSAASWLASSLAQYRPAVLGGLAHGWHRYLCALLCNTARCSSELEASLLIQRQLQRVAHSCSPPACVFSESSEPSAGRVDAGACALGEVPEVFDAVTPKLEAWRRALDVVLLVLQTDSEVVTGPGHTRFCPQGPEGLLFL